MKNKKQTNEMVFREFKVSKIKMKSIVKSRNEKSTSCEISIDETFVYRLTHNLRVISMSPYKSTTDISNTGNYWDEVCDELRTQAKEWFKDQKPSVKVAVFSRSELIAIINSKCGRTEANR